MVLPLEVAEPLKLPDDLDHLGGFFVGIRIIFAKLE